MPKNDNKTEPTPVKASTEIPLLITMIIALCVVCAFMGHLITTNKAQRPYYLKLKELHNRADSLRNVIRISDTIAARYNSDAARDASNKAAQELQKVDSAYLQVRADYDANESFIIRKVTRMIQQTK